MKAVRLHAVGDLRCESVPIPKPHGKELLLKVGACGICGSDIPRVFSHGSSNGKYPLTIGHEFAGEIVDVGESADRNLIGARGAVCPLIPCLECEPCATGNYAMCEQYDYLGSRRDGGFAEYCLLPSDWHLIRANKAEMEALAMTEPACVAQHAIRKANVTAGFFVVIFGAGPIGIIAARWANLFGAGALLVDVVPEKVDFARQKGFSAINSRESDVTDAIRRLNHGRLADAAIEGTGTADALVKSVESLRAKGAVSLLGNPIGDVTIPAKIHSTILRKELSIQGIWNSSRVAAPVNEWAYTVHMLDSGKLELPDLITDRLSLEELPKVMTEIKDGVRHPVKAVCL